MNQTALQEKFPVGNLDHLLEGAEIPVLAGPQAQGDVSWYPVEEEIKGEPIPQEGLVIVEGQNGHPHTLFADGGPVFFERQGAAGLALVPEGSTLIIGHNEHGYSAAAPGTYRFTVARQQADEVRRLAD